MKIKTTFFLSLACLLTLSGYADPRGNIGPGSNEKSPTLNEADPLGAPAYFQMQSNLRSNPTNTATMRDGAGSPSGNTSSAYYGDSTLPPGATYGPTAYSPEMLYGEGSFAPYNNPPPPQPYLPGRDSLYTERWNADMNQGYYDNFNPPAAASYTRPSNLSEPQELTYEPYYGYPIYN